MYRIQLASGNEAVYRSLEELAVGVQNGIICPDALVYHRKTGSWLPIEAHPHYHLARELVLPERLRPMGESRDKSPEPKSPVASRTAGTATPGRTPKVDNPGLNKSSGITDKATDSRPRPNNSQSIAESIRRPPASMPSQPRGNRSTGSWLMAAAVSGMATVGWVLYSPGAGDPSSGIVVAGMESPKRESSERAPVEAQSQPDALPAGEGAPSYADAYQQARVEFEQGIASLGFENLFATSLISTADGLRTARRLVAAARNVVAVYRGEEVRIDQAFDMAGASMREPYGTARSVDSLYSAIDSIYALLQAADGRYQLRRGRIAFDDPLYTAGYVGQTIWLKARLRDWSRNPARTPLTIRPIVDAVGRIPRSQTGF